MRPSLSIWAIPLGREGFFAPSAISKGVGYASCHLVQMLLVQIRHLAVLPPFLATGDITKFTYIAQHKKKNISAFHNGNKFVESNNFGSNNCNPDVLTPLAIKRAPRHDRPGSSSGRGASQYKILKQLNRAPCRTCGAMSATSARTEGTSPTHSYIMNSSPHLSRCSCVDKQQGASAKYHNILLCCLNLIHWCLCNGDCLRLS